MWLARGSKVTHRLRVCAATISSASPSSVLSSSRCRACNVVPATNVARSLSSSSSSSPANIFSCCRTHQRRHHQQPRAIKGSFLTSYGLANQHQQHHQQQHTSVIQCNSFATVATPARKGKEPAEAPPRSPRPAPATAAATAATTAPSVKPRPKRRHQRGHGNAKNDLQKTNTSKSSLSPSSSGGAKEIHSKGSCTVRQRGSATNISVLVAGKKWSVETGEIATLADGAVMGQLGNTVVMATAVCNYHSADDTGFLPLTVDYREKAHAYGKIPRTRQRREVHPSENEILVARVIDRVIRPLFPPGFCFETQIIATLNAFDKTCDPMVTAVNAASAALVKSGLPWNGPAGCVRVGLINGTMVVNPPIELLEDEGTMDLLYAATEHRTLMVELGGEEVSEQVVAAALKLAHGATQSIIASQRPLKPDTPKTSPAWEQSAALTAQIYQAAREAGYEKAFQVFTMKEFSKAARGEAEGKTMSEMTKAVVAACPSAPLWAVAAQVEAVMREALSDAVLDTKVRCDGRGVDELRPLAARVDILPQVHGSGLFTRGQTQVMSVVTLGPSLDTSSVNYLGATRLDEKKALLRDDRIYLHYEFPPYSVNEVGKVGGTNRRMVGHGNLAEKAIIPVMPTRDNFPYTTRITSEVTMSNGSSSMASACSASLGLMDAGVPLQAAVGGISVGLVTRNSNKINDDNDDGGGDGGVDDNGGGDKDGKAGKGLEYSLLLDILGTEDHYGDMDFKVAGTARGITAIQLDVKLEGGVPMDVLLEALHKAKKGRVEVLKVMNKVMRQPRPQLKAHAPRIEVVKFRPERLKEVLNTQSRLLRDFEDDYNVQLDQNIDGEIAIFSEDHGHAKEVRALLQELISDIDVGQTFTGTVVDVKDFGAMVEVLRNRFGILHISEIKHKLPEPAPPTRELLAPGQKVEVKVIDVDNVRNIVKLSRKALLEEAEPDNLKADSSPELDPAYLRRKADEANRR